MTKAGGDRNRLSRRAALTLLGAGADSRAALSGSLYTIAAPWLRVLREQRIQSGAAGALYCAHLPFIQ